MSKAATEFKTLPVFENLPELFYPVGIEMKHRILKDDEREYYDERTAEMIIVRSVPKSVVIAHDSAKYTKVFRHSSELAKTMSVPAFNMFYYIMRSLTVNQMHICITELDFLSEFGYSKSSGRLYFAAIKELITCNIIAKKSGTFKSYWINTNILFNGDRTKITGPAISYNKETLPVE